MAKINTQAKRNVKSTKNMFGEYKCKICTKVFSDNSGLSHHVQLHNTDRPFSCKLCSYTCKTRKYLTKHVKTVHQAATEHACTYCNRKFHYKCLLDQHMYIHTDARPYKCDVCGKGFNTTYSLNTHKYIHSDLKPFKCKYCAYACRDNSTLRKHEERHMGISRRYQCKMCEKSYKTKSVLKDHISEAHLDVEVKSRPCEECGRMFKSTATLNTHVKLVHEKIYSCKCDICGVEITSKYNMASHLTKHVHFKPFECSFDGCTKRFKDKSTLKKHSIIHYPDKQFACNLCERRFTRSYRLKVHMKQHRYKEKCVVCDYCGTSFYNKNYLRNHISKKHCIREKFICDRCGFLSYNKPSIVMHIKYGHGSEDDRECKICKKTFKLHKYLKLHYWNTHCIKYNMAPRKPKQKKQKLIIIKEEASDTKEIELLHEVKVEPLSDTEQDSRTENRSRKLYADGSRVKSDKTNKRSIRFEDFFIEHVMKPNDNVQAKVKIKSVNGRQLDEMCKNLIIEEKIETAKENTKESTENSLERIERNNETSAKERIDTNNESNGNIRIEQNNDTNGKEANVQENETSVKEVIGEKNEPSVKEVIKEKNEPSVKEVIGEKNEPSVKEVIEEKNEPSVKEVIEEKNEPSVKEVIGEKNEPSVKEVIEEKNEPSVKEVIGEKNEPSVKEVIEEKNEPSVKEVIEEKNEPSVKEVIEEKNEPSVKEVSGQKNETNDKDGIDENNESRLNSLESDLDDDDDDDNAGNDDSDYVNEDCENDDNDLVENNSSNPDCVSDKSAQSKRIKINTHQCYVCFKLYETKDKLISHCQEHFDVCNINMLKKCPLCDYVTQLNLPRHMLLVHKINIKINYGKIKDRKNNDNGSRFYYNVNNEKIKEIEIIPSIKNLNRRAYVELDKRKREINSKSITKTKLVKKKGEWIVEKVKIDAKSSEVVLPEIENSDYLGEMKLLYRKAKNNGQKMLFPCNKCEKVCQTLSALKLHTRKHDPNKKPFKKKVWKHKLSEEQLRKINEKPVSTNTNRYEKPKPIINKHKCDPKLKEFYETNIKGGDIEFGHFLKIFNKMSRENVNDFTDLENRTEYGIHFSVPSKNSFKVKRKKIIKERPVKNAFERKVMISKKEYRKRKAMIDNLRRNLHQNTAN